MFCAKPQNAALITGECRFRETRFKDFSRTFMSLYFIFFNCQGPTEVKKNNKKTNKQEMKNLLLQGQNTIGLK